MSSFIGGEFAGGGGGGGSSGAAGGNLDGYYPNPTVVAIQNNPIEAGILTGAQDGYVLTWNGIELVWEPQSVTSGSVTLSGDVTGAATSNHVAAIQGTPVVINTLTAGNTLSYNGTNWVNRALNLAGGSGYVTGNLPVTSLATGSTKQVLLMDGSVPTWTTLSQDVTISATGAADVVGLLSNALPSLADGYLNWTGSGWELSTINAGLTSSFIFQTSGSGENVYTTEASLAAATQALNGAEYTIFWNVPSYTFTTVGTLNLAPNGTWTGGAALTFANGTVLENPPVLAKGYDYGLGQLSISVSQTQNVCTTSSDGTTIFDGVDIYTTATGAGAFIDVSSGVYDVVFRLFGYAQGFDSTAPAFKASGGSLALSMFDATALGANATNSSVTNIQAGSTGVILDQSLYPYVIIAGVFQDASGTGPSTVPATGSNQGTFILDGPTGALYYSNGTNWVLANAAPTGAAGGNLSGTYPNPTVIAINGTSVPATPTANQVLVATSGTAATWELISNAQVSTTAAIAVSKLASGTSAQLLLNNSTPTPTWTTMSGDVTISNTGATTVGKLQGTTITITSLTTGNSFSYNGTAWVNAALNLGGGSAYVTGTLPAGNQAAQTLAGDVTGTTAADTVVSLTGSTGTVTIPHGTTNISGATAASDVAPGTITITGQLPFASASTNKTPGGITLATGTPVSGGNIGTVSVVNDGYTQLQLGYATTDFIALGLTPGSAGYVRTPALAVSTTYLQLGTVPVIYAQASNNLAFGSSSALLTQINSGGQLTLNTGSNIVCVAGSTSVSLTSNLMAPNTAYVIAPSAKTVTANTMAVNAGAGTGAASSSVAGGALSFTGGAAGVATSGTSAGAAGGALTATGGAGAAGLGSNQNGGAGGNTTIGSGAGGAATGSGTPGAAGAIINQIGGTTVMSLGVNGVGLTFANTQISGLTGGTTTLSSAQYLAPIIRLSGTLTSAATIVFPNAAGMWFVDVSSLLGVSGTNTLTFQSGSATTTAVTSLTSLSSIYMISTYGGNTISINV